MERVTQLVSLYDMVERLQAKGRIANTYGGCEDDWMDPDGDVLSEFMEYIFTYYADTKMDDWLEAFSQILGWQYQSMHEGVETYYENFYGVSSYPEIVRTAEYLQQNGYLDIYEQFHRGIAECEQYEYPEEMKAVAKEIDVWIDHHTKEVWDFCVDVLAKHKKEWIENNEEHGAEKLSRKA